MINVLLDLKEVVTNLVDRLDQENSSPMDIVQVRTHQEFIEEEDRLAGSKSYREKLVSAIQLQYKSLHWYTLEVYFYPCIYLRESTKLRYLICSNIF